MKYQSKTYIVKCLTSLHVGSGDNNYGVIDKQVQRDVVTSIPIIHSSSLKGAIRDYFNNEIDYSNETDKVTLVNSIFGSDKNDKDKMKQGGLRFLDANLLAIPVRGKKEQYFYRASSNYLIDRFNLALGKSSSNKISIKEKIIYSQIELTEFEKCCLVGTVNYIGDNTVLIEDGAFKNEVLAEIPIVARNCLDNGESKNLWYEEYIPAESVFYFSVAYDVEDAWQSFNHHIQGRIIQIGANATIGYGLCEINLVGN